MLYTRLRPGTAGYLLSDAHGVHEEERERKTEDLEDVDVIAVIKKQVKQRQDSIEQFKNGGRPELAEKEQAELDILKGYLPQELSEEELQKIVEAAIEETNAASMKEMGSVMKVVVEKAQGRADNKKVSELVKNNLMK